MEVTLKAGDSLNIPEGCKAVIKDNVVVFEKDVCEFKNGDVLHSVYDDITLIFKSYEESGIYAHCDSNGWGNSLWDGDAFRHATEEEKQLLFDKMKEQGLQWNAEEKRVEKLRWRASIDEKYHHISKLLDYNSEIEGFLDFDEEMWKVGNYFRTEEQAKEAARRIKETLFKYHEEIGE